MRASTLIIMALTLFASRSSGQGASRVTSTVLLRDSVIARIVGVALVQHLATSIVQAALDTTTRAVVLDFPDAEAPEAWQQLRVHLLAALRGRPRVDADEQELVVSVGPARIVGDTLVVMLGIVSRMACDGEWRTAMEQTDEVRAMRGRGGKWFFTEPRFRGESIGGCLIVPGSSDAH